MVVATGAGDRQADEGLGGRVDALVDGVVLVVKALADGDEAQGRQTRVFLLEVGQAVGGQLLDDELVVGLVGVEGIDDVVAERPSVGVTVVLEERVALVDRQTARIGISRGIQPVAAPTLAVMGRREEFVHFLGHEGVDSLGGLATLHGTRIGGHGPGVLDAEGVHLVGGGRQADQVIMDAA